MDTQLKVMTRSVMAAVLCIAGSADAQTTVSDNFTLYANQTSWTTIGGACLTAASGINGVASLPVGTTAAASVIPTCVVSANGNAIGGYGDSTNPNGYLANNSNDPSGNGALRLTSATGNQAGAIIWNSTFPSASGIAITFTAVSYDGNSYAGTDGGHNGADGLSFFLLDASVTPANIGQYGGSLGYSCAQGKANGGGATGGYIGLGIDEYGNFLNSGDNTDTGVTNTVNSSYGQFQGNRIGVRGAGEVNWQQLSTLYPSYYPSTMTASQQDSAIWYTCSTGQIWNFSSGTAQTPCAETFAGLNAAYPSFYPTTLTATQKAAAVASTCSTGKIWNYSASAPSGTPSECLLTFSQLSSSYPSYYPSSLTATQQTAALNSSCSTSNVWDYSGSSSSPAYNASTYDLGQCYTYAQLTAANASYYPATVASSLQSVAVADTCTANKLYQYSDSVSTTISSHVSTHVTHTTTTTSTTYTTTYTTTYGFTETSTALSVPSAIGLTTTITSPGYQAVSVPDYAVISYLNASNQTVYASSVLSVPIANEVAGARNAASNLMHTYSGATEYTYNLTITSNGLLSLSYTSNANNSSGTTVVATNWPIFSSNGTLPTNFTFGFAASTGGGTNIHEITCFQAAPAEDTDTSAAINGVEAGQVKTNTAVYLAYYHTHDWWGQLTSTLLTTGTGSSITVSLAADATWDASCVLTGDGSGTTLTGGNCQATGGLTTDPATAPTSRVMLTSSGGAGIAFESTSLTTTQLGYLGGATGDDGQQTKRIAYLRGDRSNEINQTTAVGLFRARVSVLGDIVNSSPTWYGAPSQYYPTAAWSDFLYPTATMPESSATYGAFQTGSASTRLGIVYVGANDGFLHGFEAGSPAATGNTGQELFAYMPNAVLQTIHNASNATLDFSSALYGHNYYVDGTPGVGDLFYNGAWHTWVVGGLGAGGSAIYALDVTNPSATNFTEANAADLVMGEWTPSTTAIAGMGNTYGTPQIVRLHSGNWGFIFGSGYNATSAAGAAGIYIAEIDTSSTTTAPTVTFTFLPVPTAGGTNDNVFSASPVDLDGDGITDYVYAGDTNGNLWRFDVTGNTDAAWAAATPVLLFTTPTGEPISTAVRIVSAANTSGSRRLIVDFGTGEQLPNGTNPNSNTYASSTQALYGIWDGNMTAWNSLASNASATRQYDSFPSTVTGSVASGGGIVTIGQNYTVRSSDLVTQSNTVSNSYTTSTGTVFYREISNNTPCWADGSNTCSTYGARGEYGWTYQLNPSTTSSSGANYAPEQVIASPIVVQGAFIVNTYIAQAQAACTTSNPTGWTIALNAATGATLSTPFFPSTETDVNGNPINEGGVENGATGSPSVVSTPHGTYLINNSAPPTAITLSGNVGTRLNWTELR